MDHTEQTTTEKVHIEYRKPHGPVFISKSRGFSWRQLVAIVGVAVSFEALVLALAYGKVADAYGSTVQQCLEKAVHEHAVATVSDAANIAKGVCVADWQQQPNLGHIVIRALPSANVFVDDVPFGETPFEPVLVNPGSHRVRLINEDRSIDRTVQVYVKPGSTASLKERME